MKYGEKLKAPFIEAVEFHGFTLAELARKSELSLSMLRLIKGGGASPNMRADNKKRLRQALPGLDLEEPSFTEPGRFPLGLDAPVLRSIGSEVFAYCDAGGQPEFVIPKGSKTFDSPAQGLQCLNDALVFLDEVYGKKTCIARFLPCEIGGLTFMSQVDEKIIEPLEDGYLAIIEKIIRLGEAHGNEYWDWSVYWACNDAQINRETRTFIGENFFYTRRASKVATSSNTSALGLFRKGAFRGNRGLVLIGRTTGDNIGPADPGKAFDRAEWAIGFSLRFEDLCMPRITVYRQESEIKTLVSEAREIFEKCGPLLGNPPGPESRLDRLNISADRIHSRNLLGWTDFLEEWYDNNGWT